MKDTTHNLLVVMVILLMIGSVASLIILGAKSEKEKKDEICKKIGDVNNLDFLFQSHGRCGWGLDCHYQCRFVNSQGDQITKNVK